VIYVNFETEEIYESRAYEIAAPEAVITIAEHAEKQGRSLTPRDQAVLFATLFFGGTVKLLAKRSLADGQMHYLVTAVNDFGRVVVDRGQLEDPSSFRRFVDELERELILPGLFDQPMVITHEEWQRYESERERPSP
jgi:hypothetical protein